jgi:hypothetical protein
MSVCAHLILLLFWFSPGDRADAILIFERARSDPNGSRGLGRESKCTTAEGA